MDRRKLDNLVKIGSLDRELPDPHEVEALIESGRVRLIDAENADLSLESRFDLAYNSSHALALAALRQCGYRSKNRYPVFQCLTHTVDIPDEEWRALDDAHRKRNIADYEGVFDVTEELVVNVIAVARQVLEKLTV